MNITLCLLIPLIIVIVFIIYNVRKINSIENFTSNQNSDKLFIKKTNNLTKIFSNDKYSIWEPIPINNYYPIGQYISLTQKKPDIMATLVKNNIGETMDKPFQYIIQCITNNQWGIWKPIPKDNYKSISYIYSKEYPSKYLIRCIPSKYCIKSNIKNKLLTNKLNKNDNGYELWSILDSDFFIVNNLNNQKNISNFKDIYSLNQNYLDIEHKLYIKFTNKYKKIYNYKDSVNNKEFYIWRPIPDQNFCSLGDICLDSNIDPNKKINTIIAHKSMCKTPLNYGTKSIYSFKDKTTQINFWRPKPEPNYYFFSDIIVLGNEEPDSDNIIYSISIDYISKINEDTHKMVYNNINTNNPLSIWCDENKFCNINTNYNNVNKNHYILNTKFIKSDTDILDTEQNIIIKYKDNKKLKKNNSITDNDLIYLIKKNLSSKLDININRITNIILNKNKRELSVLFNSRGLNKNELTIEEVLIKLEKIIKTSDVKIFNELKNLYYITIDNFYNKKPLKKIKLDNSLYSSKFTN